MADENEISGAYQRSTMRTQSDRARERILSPRQDSESDRSRGRLLSPFGGVNPPLDLFQAGTDPGSGPYYPTPPSAQDYYRDVTRSPRGSEARYRGLTDIGRAAAHQRGEALDADRIPTSEDVDAAKEISVLEHFGGLELIAYPQRVIWGMGAFLGALLPDPSSEEDRDAHTTLSEHAGDFLKWGARASGILAATSTNLRGGVAQRTMGPTVGEQLSEWMGLPELPNTWWGNIAALATGLPAQDPKARVVQRIAGLPATAATASVTSFQDVFDAFQDTDRLSLAGDIGANLYEGFATGDFWKLGLEGPSYWTDNHNILMPNLAMAPLWWVSGMGPMESGAPAPLKKFVEQRTWGVDEDSYFSQWLLPSSHRDSGALSLFGSEGLFPIGRKPEGQRTSFNLQGEDILEYAIPKELAEKIALTYPEGSDKRKLWEAVGTQTFRTILGIAMEIAVDPLWMLGPARTVSGSAKLGGQTFAVHQDVTRAAGTLSTVSQQVGGTTRSSVNVAKLIEEADSRHARTLGQLRNERASRLRNLEEAVNTRRAAYDKAKKNSENNPDSWAFRDALFKELDLLLDAEQDLFKFKYGEGKAEAASKAKAAEEAHAAEVSSIKSQQPETANVGLGLTGTSSQNLINDSVRIVAPQFREQRAGAVANWRSHIDTMSGQRDTIKGRLDELRENLALVRDNPDEAIRLHREILNDERSRIGMWGLRRAQLHAQERAGMGTASAGQRTRHNRRANEWNKVIDEQNAQIKNALDDLANGTMDPAETIRVIQHTINSLEGRHKGLDVATRRAERVFRDLLAAKPDLVSETGGIVYSLPFSPKTKRLFPTNKKLWNGDIVEEVVSPPNMSVEPPSIQIKDLTVKQVFESPMSDGEKLSYLVLKSLNEGPRRAGQLGAGVMGNLERVGSFMWEIFAKLFGPRVWRPHLTRLYAKSEAAALRDSGRISGALMSGGLASMLRVPDEIWAAYTDAFGKFSRDLRGMDDEAISRQTRLFKEATRVAELRREQAAASKAVGKRGRQVELEGFNNEEVLKARTDWDEARRLGDQQKIDEAAERYRVATGRQIREVQEELSGIPDEWFDPNYSYQDVLAEAASQWEMGGSWRDFLKEHPEMLFLAEEMDELVSFISHQFAVPVDQIRQALYQVVARGQGDPQLFREAMEMYQPLIDQLETIESERKALHSQYESAIPEWMPTTEERRRLVDAVNDAASKRRDEVNSTIGRLNAEVDAFEDDVRKIRDSFKAEKAAIRDEINRVKRSSEPWVQHKYEGRGDPKNIEEYHKFEHEAFWGGPKIKAGHGKRINKLIKEAEKRHAKRLEELKESRKARVKELKDELAQSKKSYSAAKKAYEDRLANPVSAEELEKAYLDAKKAWGDRLARPSPTGSPFSPTSLEKFKRLYENKTIPHTWDDRYRVWDEGQTAFFDEWEHDPGVSDIHLEQITVFRNRRGKGVGSRMMQEITKMADEAGLTLSLEALAKEGAWMSSDQLVEWYGRHGFKLHPEHGIDGLMVRPPSPVDKTLEELEKLMLDAERAMNQEAPSLYILKNTMDASEAAVTQAEARYLKEKSRKGLTAEAIRRERKSNKVEIQSIEKQKTRNIVIDRLNSRINNVKQTERELSQKIKKYRSDAAAERKRLRAEPKEIRDANLNALRDHFRRTREAAAEARAEFKEGIKTLREVEADVVRQMQGDDEWSLPELINHARPRMQASKAAIDDAEEAVRRAENIDGNIGEITKARKKLREAYSSGDADAIASARVGLDQAKEDNNWQGIVEARQRLSSIKKEMPLEEWEIEMWSRFRLLTEPTKHSRKGPPGVVQSKFSFVDEQANVGDFTEEDILLAAMLPTRHLDSPVEGHRLGHSIPVDSPLYEKMAKRYGEARLISKRFVDDIDDDLLPIYKELASIFSGYQEDFMERGFDFVMDPVTIMRRHGVINWLPHIREPKNMADALDRIVDTRQALEEAKKSGDVIKQAQANAEYNEALAGREKRAALDREPGSARTQRMLKSESTIDELFNTRSDSEKSRQWFGTIAEINALKDAPDFTLDPTELLARCMQFNRRITAHDMLGALVQGGVARTLKATPEKTVLQQMVEGDYVSLFRSITNVQDESITFDVIETIFSGNRDSWVSAGISEQTVKALIDANRKPDHWNNWFRDIEAVSQGSTIELAIMVKRLQEYNNGGAELLDISKAFKARMQDPKVTAEQAWGEIAATLNDALRNSQHLWPEAGASIKGVGDLIKPLPANMVIKPKHLSNYYQKQLWQMVVPRQVASNLDELLQPRLAARWKQADSKTKQLLGGGAGLALDTFEKVNNFWKTRLTVMAIGFTVRNAMANKIVNLIDLGPEGAFNVKTMADAHILSFLAPLYELGGGVENGLRLIQKEQYLKSLPKRSRHPLEWAKTKAKKAAVQFDSPHKVYQSTIEMHYLMTGRHLLRDGIDLGDGIVRDIDSAIVELKRRGVIAQSYNQYIDIDRAGQQAAIIAKMKRDPESTAGLASRASDFAKDSLAAAEDAFWITMPMAVSGLPIPISFGRKYGASLARHVENNARLINFMGNLKRGGSWDDAVAHVNKYLFDYGDLTGHQKSIMRTIIPFFVWRSKNIQLHGQLMVEKPYVFSTYYRFLFDGAQKITRAMDADISGVDHHGRDQYSQHALEGRRSYALKRARFSLPGLKNIFIEGTQTPIEAAAEDLGTAVDLFEGLSVKLRSTLPVVPIINPADAKRAAELKRESTQMLGMRWVSDLSFPIKVAMEAWKDHHFFYDMPISELAQAGQIGTLIKGLDTVPGVGPMLSNGMREITGYREAWHPRSNRAYAFSDAIWALGSTPWSRLVTDLTASVDIFNSSLANSPEKLREAGFNPDTQRTIGVPLRYLRVLAGVRIISDDPVRNRMYNSMEWNDAFESWLDRYGITEQRDRRILK